MVNVLKTINAPTAILRDVSAIRHPDGKSSMTASTPAELPAANVLKTTNAVRATPKAKPAILQKAKS